MSARPSCRKTRYRDELAAKIALANTHLSDKSTREEARAYRCDRCHGWHLTSQARA